MSLDQKIADGFTKLSTELKASRTAIGNNVDLTTAAKSTLVAAINEVKAGIGGAGATINDASPSTVAVYSSSKTEAVANAAATVAVGTLIGAAPAALDTVYELAAQMLADEGAVQTLTNSIGNRVRFDAAQTLTAPQKTQALANMGAVASTDIGNVNTDFVAVVAAALA